MPKPSKINDSDIYRLELHRRFDEIHAIIRYACVLFSKEHRLELELKEVERVYKSKWFWIPFIFGFILNIALRESDFFSFEFEWNFGTYVLTFCLLILTANLTKERLIRNKLESNLDKLKELVFKFDVITSEGYKLWDVRGFIDEYGQIKSCDEDEDSLSKSYMSWLKRISENLEYKVKSYTED